MKVNIASLMAEHELPKQNRTEFVAKSIFNVLRERPFYVKMSLKMQYEK